MKRLWRVGIYDRNEFSFYFVFRTYYSRQSITKQSVDQSRLTTSDLSIESVERDRK